jgi:hypothetical protein
MVLATKAERRRMIDSFEDLGSVVDLKGGVYTVSASKLRDLIGNDRLGARVSVAILEALDAKGLSTFPAAGPFLKDDLVRVYRKGSPVAKLHEAIAAVGADSDKFLRAVTSKTKLAGLVGRLKDLVAEFEE